MASLNETFNVLLQLEEELDLEVERDREEDGVRERAGLEGGAGGGLAEGAGGHRLPLRTLLPQQRCHRTG